METQKIVNLLDGSTENGIFASGNWYVIDSESKSRYLQDDAINFSTKSYILNWGIYFGYTKYYFCR